MNIGRMRLPLAHLAATVGFLVVLCGCGGSGSGGGSAPTLRSAVFVGAGPTPTAGDQLWLVFSEDVFLVSGAVIDDTDIVFSPAGSVGNVSAPVLQNSRTVRVDLGTGANFTPGSTTVTVNTDAIQNADGAFPEPTASATITAGDGDAPTIDLLTTSGVGASLNGTGAAGGTLQVPANGFTIDLTYSDSTSPITAANTVISTTANVSLPSGTNDDITGALDLISSTATSATFLVPATVTFPQGAITISAIVQDDSGMVSSPATFSFLVKNIADNLRPFENGQVWELSMDRDVESYNVDLMNPNTPVEVTAGANGRSDIEDLFLVVGLYSTTNTATNATVLGQFRAALLARLAALHTTANVTFTFTDQGAFPSGQTSVSYGSLGFSQMSIAGSADASGDSGILGIAIFDEHNDNQNDNTVTDFPSGGSTVRLGVFVHTAVNEGMKPGITLFRQTYSPFAASLGGTPIGDDGQDAARLAGTLSDSRATEITAAVESLANITAIVLAHECGHSVGLVANGPMPGGLYGNSANFPGSSDGHIRNASDFPAGSTNVMSPALSFSAAQQSTSTFNSLNLAYLLERVLQDR